MDVQVILHLYIASLSIYIYIRGRVGMYKGMASRLCHHFMHSFSNTSYINPGYRK